MKDVTIPTFQVFQEGVPIRITVPNTQAQLEDQGNTFNQAGHSFNQAGDVFGGIYSRNQDVTPIIDTARLESPTLTILTDSLFLKMKVPQTQAQVEDQGNTFNQAGHSFNQAGDMFGGIYNRNQAILPLTLTFEDIYGKTIIPPSASKNGPGFFLYVNLT